MTDTTTACREALIARLNRAANGVKSKSYPYDALASLLEESATAIATVQTGEVVAVPAGQVIHCGGLNSYGYHYASVGMVAQVPTGTKLYTAPPDHEALRAENERLKEINTKWATDNNNLRHEIAELQAQLTQSHQAAGVPCLPCLPPKYLSWQLDEETAKFLADMITANDEPTPVTLSVGFCVDDDGKLEYGLRVHEIDYPEEGASMLVQMDMPSAPTAPATVAQSGVDEREAFEKFARIYNLKRDPVYDYEAVLTRVSWEAWQARALLATPAPSVAKG